MSGGGGTFFGLIVKPNKRYDTNVKETFRISKACIYPSSAGGKVTTLYVECDGEDFILANLSDKNLNETLDIGFTVGEKIAFKVEGPGTVHLTGNIAEDEPDFMDSSMMEDESEEEEEEEVEEAKGGKRKKEANGGPTKKIKADKAVNGVEESSDDSDSDDSDEEGGETTLGDLETTDNFAEEEESDDDDDDSEDDDDEAADTTKEGKDDSDDDDSDDSDEEDDDDDESSDDEEEEEKKKKSPAKPVMNGKKSEQTPNKKAAAATTEEKSAKKKEKETPKKDGKQEEVKTPASKKPEAGKTPKGDMKTPKSSKEEGGKTPKNKEEVKTPKNAAVAATPKSSKKTMKGGIVVEELKEGNGPECKPGKHVGMYYAGRLKSNNKQFDACISGKPFKFKLGKGEVIKGWDIGLQGMKVGGKRKITIPPNMGYGSSGAPPAIPPNSTLVFEVECKFVN
eukprot:TRINITY_DN10971_c0_g1_i1.p1 TRINITY_DN10971_c0_g1~~TRINITY_DN10971_c0_g1_i1.p1  ORF type:complete len:453 (-),score=174.19 TRINITY_DN10971_c0_g1_i1:230-1588(-)